MSYESLLNTTCTIQSKTKTQSNSGAVAFTWATKASGVKTAKRRNNQPKIYDDLLKTYVDDYIFYFLIGASVTIADRILMPDGRTFEVLTAESDSRGHHLKVLAKLTQK